MPWPVAELAIDPDTELIPSLHETGVLLLEQDVGFFLPVDDLQQWLSRPGRPCRASIFFMGIAGKRLSSKGFSYIRQSLHFLLAAG